MARGSIRRIPCTKILTQQQVSDIHNATMRILRETGVSVRERAALEMLADNGCQVDFEKQVVRMDETFVMDAVARVPREYILRALTPEENCVISTETMVVTPAPGMKSVDLNTWETYVPSRKEYYDYMRVLNGLDEVDMHTAFPWAGFTQTPQCMCMIESFAAKARCSGKAIWEGNVMDNYRFIVKMAQALDIDVWVNTNPTSPLTFMKETVELMRYLCEAGMPFSITSGPIPGVTAPVTLAGTIALNNADVLAANAIAQTIRPGTRVIGGSLICILNMRTSSPQFANAFSQLAESALTQIWKGYGIPSMSTCVGWSNAKMLDYQAGYEINSAFTTMALTGASVVSYVGGITAELTAHPVKAVIDNDIVKLIRRVLQGVDINEDTLGLDMIQELGFAPTSYLGEEHTVEYFRQEISQAQVADLSIEENWVKAGKPTIIDHAKQRMREILEKETFRLDAEKEQKLEAILNEAREYYRANGSISDEEWEIYQAAIRSDTYPFA